MSTLGGILGVARGAVLAQQSALQVTSNNVANAETPGYTRQRATLTAAPSVTFPNGTFGTGVLVTDVQRLRDTMLDTSYRRQSAGAANASLASDVLGKVEGVFNEPASTALASTLDQFWGAWGDLANSPTSSSARTMVQQRGAQLSDAFHAADSGLTQVAADTRASLDANVSQVNALAGEIAKLNVGIVSAEVGGHVAGDLRDQRDMRIDELSKLADVNVVGRKDGSTGIYVGTAILVDGDAAKSVSLTGTGATLGFAIGSQAVRAPGGETGAALDAITRTIPDARAKLDDLARQVVTGVNAISVRGYSAAAEKDDATRANWAASTPAASQGSRVAFFSTDAGGTTAAGIKVADEVARDAGYVTTGYTRYGTSDNALALDVAALRTSPASGTVTIGEQYRSLIAGIASSTSSAGSAADAATALAEQADTRRQSVSGVSTDEELIQMMKHQQAYAAAAKVVSAVDEMMQTLLGMK